jgi:hypothetical protein
MPQLTSTLVAKQKAIPDNQPDNTDNEVPPLHKTLADQAATEDSTFLLTTVKQEKLTEPEPEQSGADWP